MASSADLTCPVAVGVWQKEGLHSWLKDRFDHHLRHAVPHARNGQRAHAACRLRNVHLAGWPRLILAGAQFARQQSDPAMGFDGEGIAADAIATGRAFVAVHAGPAFEQRFGRRCPEKQGFPVDFGRQ